jgi:hypothetical protein
MREEFGAVGALPCHRTQRRTGSRPDLQREEPAGAGEKTQTIPFRDHTGTPRPLPRLDQIGHDLPDECPNPCQRFAALVLQVLNVRVDVLGGEGGSCCGVLVVVCKVAMASVIVLSLARHRNPVLGVNATNALKGVSSRF